MRISQPRVQVLIVGAGPSGLMMAAQLLRYGIRPAIIDARKGPTNHSKALAVQARSLEIYRQMGIDEPVLKEGKQAPGLEFFVAGHPSGTFAITDAGEGFTPFPYLHLYPQSKNERVLLNYLTQNSCPVYWNTSLISLQQGTGVVSVKLKTDNEEYSLLCEWLIGADGAHSTVRHHLQIPFNGDTYPNQFYLADVVLNYNTDDIKLYLTTKGFAGFFPMPDKNSFRLLGSLPPALSHRTDITLEDIIPLVEEKTKIPLQVVHCNWFTTYRLHHRMAAQFGRERCFLIGDAAHIHSPVGGQGMNTGLQDAYNLAWKLAGVINGHQQQTILGTYADERMPIAKDLLKTTDRAFNIIMANSFWANLLKRWALPLVLKTVWKNKKARFEFFKRISQTGINYRHSQLNLHLSQLQTIKAGDRLPYFKIYDEKKQQETDLHAWCSKPGFTLITMGALQDSFLFSLAKWITQSYNGWLNFFHLPPSVKNQQVFDAFGVKTNQNKALIVRPDMYIGLINDVVDVEMMSNYLNNVAGCIPANRQS